MKEIRYIKIRMNADREWLEGENHGDTNPGWNDELKRIDRMLKHGYRYEIIDKVVEINAEEFIDGVEL